MQHLLPSAGCTSTSGLGGVGKSTVPLQYVRTLLSLDRTAIFSLEDGFFREHDVVETVADLHAEGYRYFLLDEVHCYPEWLRAAKALTIDRPSPRIAIRSSAMASRHLAHESSRRDRQLSAMLHRNRTSSDAVVTDLSAARRWATASLLLFAIATSATAQAPTRPPDRDSVALLLDSLLGDAIRSGVTAFAITRGDTVLASYRRPGSPDIVSGQSMTKSVVSLAVGKLIGSGAIPSLDVRVADYVPALDTGGKADITLRHVLTHRTGLSAGDNFGLDVESALDPVAYAAGLPLELTPGERFVYNNAAIHLARPVITAACGTPMRDFVRDSLLLPLGITDFAWTSDMTGDAWAHADLHLSAEDWARIGELVVGRGEFRGKRIIPESWFAEAAPREFSGPLATEGVWWFMTPDPSSRCEVPAGLTDALLEAGLADTLATALRELERDGPQPMDDLLERYAAIGRPGMFAVREARIAAGVDVFACDGTNAGASTNGGGGQYLVVDFATGLAVVQLIAPGDIGEGVGVGHGLIGRVAEIARAMTRSPEAGQ